MVPQRALPYRMIAVLGLNDGEFPRRSRPLQLDPLPRHPRIGDRDVVSDDRYLFLETLMSARDRLHLSWVGEDPQDGSPREPSPVLSELMEMLDGNAGDAARHWLVEHPLQPFDAGYVRDPAATSALRSFGPLWRPPRLTAPPCAAAIASAASASNQAESRLPAAQYRAQHAAAPRPHEPLIQDASKRLQLPSPSPDAEGHAGATKEPGDSADTVALESLRAWLRNPARELLRQRWRMPLRGLDHATLAADEPLDIRLDARDALWRELLAESLRTGLAPPEAPGALLLGAGRLPPGRPGLLAYARQREIAAALHRASAALPALAADSEPLTLPLDIKLADMRVDGDSGLLYRTANSFWLLEWVDHARRFKRLATRLDLRLRQAAIALSLPPGSALQIVRLAPDTQDPWAARLTLSPEQLDNARDELLEVLRTVVGCWRQSQTQPLAYFPEASAALFEARDVEQIWHGDAHQRGERDWSPGYAWLLAAEQRFWEPEDPAYASFHATSQLLFGLLDRPDATASQAAGP
jgi:exodeoxyribonuclease V gamma subunit